MVDVSCYWVKSANKRKEQRLRQPSNYRWAVLFASFFTFVAFAFVFQLVPPVIEQMMQDFSLEPSQAWIAGFLMSIVVIPGIALALSAGRLVDRHGFRLIGLASTILTVVGSFVTAVSNLFWTALLGRFVLGVGGAFIITGMPTVIPQWFSREDIGKAMGIYGTNMPVATISAFLTASVLRAAYGWRYPFYIGTTVAAISVAVFALIVREGPLKHGKESRRTPKVRTALANLEIWKVGLVWGFFNTTAIAFLTWAPTALERFRNLEPVKASLLAGVLMIAAIPFVPVFGWASDKTGRRKPFMIAGSLLMALALIASGFASGFSLALSVIALGIAASMVPPLVMTMPPEILNPDSVGIGFGVLTMCQNIGITFGPPFTGYLLATTNAMESTFIGTAVFAVVGSFVAYTLKSK
jgi:MFS family permease